MRNALAIVGLVAVMLFPSRIDAACRSTRRLPAVTRGLYLAVPLAAKKNLPRMVALASRAGINTLVVDVKDASGRVSLKDAESVPMVTMQAEADLVDMQGLKAFRKKSNGWLIARVTMFLDPCLARKRPEFAIKRSDGTLYEEGSGGACGANAFTSPFLEEVWDYHVELARRALAAGFDEIQLDYVRFPDQPLGTLVAPKPEWDDTGRIEAITVGVARLRAELPRSAVLSADVFGRTVRESDPIIGQDIRMLAPYVDYISPMLYPSLWPSGSFDIANPVAAPYQIIDNSLGALDEWMRHTPCPPRVRPWLQTGEWPGMLYGVKETQAEIEAASARKVRDWMFWQDAGVYDPEAIRPATGKDQQLPRP